MPRISLTQKFVKRPPLPKKGKAKETYFDTQLTGFMLEVRKNGKATYYLRYRDLSSRAKQVRIGDSKTITLEEARDKARALKSQAIMGFDPRAEQSRLKSIPTFKQFVQEQYIPYVKTYKRSWYKDKQFIELRLYKLLGNTQMHEITARDVIAFQTALLDSLKPGTVNRCMALVKYIFNLAERWEVIEKAPTRNIRMIEDAGTRERYLNSEEVFRLLDVLRKRKNRLVPDIIELLLLTGARKSEVTGLRWNELDFDKRLWTLPAVRNKSKKIKVVPLSKEAIAVLDRNKGNDSKYVFPSPKTGRPLSDIYDTWESIRVEAGMPELRIHDLRHSFASFLVNSGRSLYEVQKLLGHSQLSTTQRYAHLSEETLQDAAEIVGAQVGSWWEKNAG